MTYDLIWNDGNAFNVPTSQKGFLVKPCESATREALPYRYRFAFDRSHWKELRQCFNGPVISLSRNMSMRSGKIVTIYAKPST
jgi:hypothetical protein